jgi:hypothetical protein
MRIPVNAIMERWIRSRRRTKLAEEHARGNATYSEVSESEADLEGLAKIAACDYFTGPGGQARDVSCPRARCGHRIAHPSDLDRWFRACDHRDCGDACVVVSGALSCRMLLASPITTERGKKCDCHV